MFKLLLCLNIILMGSAALVSVPEEVLSVILGCERRNVGPRIPISTTHINPVTGTTTQEVSMMDIDQLRTSLQDTVSSNQVIEQILSQVEESLRAQEEEKQSRHGCTNIKIDVPPQEIQGLSETIQAVVQQNNYQLLEQINTLFTFKLNSFHREIEMLLNATLDEIKTNKVKCKAVESHGNKSNVPTADTNINTQTEVVGRPMDLPTREQETPMEVVESESGPALKDTEERIVVLESQGSDMAEKNNVLAEIVSDAVQEEKVDIARAEIFEVAEPVPLQETEPEPETEPESEPEPKISRFPGILKFRRNGPTISDGIRSRLSHRRPPTTRKDPISSPIEDELEEGTEAEEVAAEVRPTKRQRINPRRRMQLLLAERRERFRNG